MHRLHLGQISQAQLGAEGRELAHRFQVGPPGVAVADVGAKEVAQPLLSLGWTCGLEMFMGVYG
jgi:hypothetical protein